MRYDIQLKRVYQPAHVDDGSRVLVDRLWPRGKRKEELGLDFWHRDVAPSTDLRRRWHARQISRDQFVQAYEQHLGYDLDVLIPLMQRARQQRLTLLTASRDLDNSHLPVLQQVLLRALHQDDRKADGDEPSSPPCFGL